MARKRKPKIEFRYYETMARLPILALTGERWKYCSGTHTDCLHFHNLMEIGFCYNGNGCLVLQDKPYPIHKNMFSVIPKNYGHTTDSIQDSIISWEYLFIDVDRVLNLMYDGNERQIVPLKRAINQRAHFLSTQDYPEIATCIQAVFKEIQEEKPYYTESVLGLTGTLLLYIARLNLHKQETRTAMDDSGMEQIAPALEWLLREYHNPVRVTDLAECCHISEPHFRRVFKQIMGITPLEYINKVRIMNASQMLLNEDENIVDVAYKVGYASEGTFIRNFKRYMGQLPNQFKKLPRDGRNKLDEYEVFIENGW
ncbi:AraC family transcriptional regulator [Lactonifactor longoviformis]|uniref:AraC-type DNA-binding protein n=1 Tax=Lactonifactor longoviformis DSM 17459 TaxID=1122155 RepID=A0A1M5CUV8_9CLOT|nr:AraC family transcriptional regulator [Lactonifactor longoviformis]POP31206.1 AraC family transcriptional regulator [Lactonifactor longoviformis]SHF58548.1 AraC-type DNA-binding protein [Lactonifactor longoviformis DSM 17459]